MPREIIERLKKIYRVNLNVRPDDRVLVFTDLVAEGEKTDEIGLKRRKGLIRIARAAVDAAREIGLEAVYSEFPALGSHGTEPGEELWKLAFGEGAVRALNEKGLLSKIRLKTASPAETRAAREIVSGEKSSAVSVVVALSNYSTSHTRFRDMLTSEAGARYASMPLFEEDMLFGSMEADWGEVAERSRRIAIAIDGADTVRITTPDGTDITFGIKGRVPMVDTGILSEPGAFSNLPAGEVYLAPVEGTGEGVLMLLWAPDRKLSNPVTVKVRGGRAAEVDGDEPFVEEFRASLDNAPGNRNLAELGIGTNDRATKPDNVLESEKIFGTIHLAFGDNSSFGGTVSTPFHQDFVFFKPTLYVSRGGITETIINSGKLEI
ncbi:MAG: aminopeptidase [Nitrospirota bacterium]